MENLIINGKYMFGEPLRDESVTDIIITWQSFKHNKHKEKSARAF